VNAHWSALGGKESAVIMVEIVKNKKGKATISMTYPKGIDCFNG